MGTVDDAVAAGLVTVAAVVVVVVVVVVPLLLEESAVFGRNCVKTNPAEGTKADVSGALGGRAWLEAVGSWEGV